MMKVKTRKTKLSYVIDVPKVSDEASLVFAETHKHIPFDIKRIYYILKADDNAHRGKHAHRKLHQVLFCIQGSITMVLDNGTEREEVVLKNPNRGIFIGNYTWREMKNFKKDTILLVLASEYYNESDYIRDYDVFLEEVRALQKNSLFARIKEIWEQIKLKMPAIADLRIAFRK